ncbi:cytochrome P450 [Amylocystis lapponica]|nr:cytochrome P450 [Amylocystis lapponica]
MDHDVLALYSLFGVIIVVIYSLLAWFEPLRSIPAIGFSGFLTPYIRLGSLRYVLSTKRMVRDGYEKYRNGIFRIAGIDHWIVVVSGPKLIQEISRAPDDQLSMKAALCDLLQVDYTLDKTLEAVPIHERVIKLQLTRNLSSIFPAMRDELVASCSSVIPLRGQDWTQIPALESMMSIICQTTNRVFVGPVLCRDPGFQSLSLALATRIVKLGMILHFVPSILRPIVGRLLSNERDIQRAADYLVPLLEERQKNIDAFGHDYPDKPADALMWLMEDAKMPSKSPREIVLRILILNLAAVHTSSITLTHAMFDLAVHPQYIEPLREEIESAIDQEGWTKAGINKMVKLDSFLKETQRCNAQILSISRKVMKPFTFSDGTRIPVGAFIGVPVACTHEDDEYYTNARTFDGSRFYNSEKGQRSMVTTDAQHLAFGHGQHSCPGRFFASAELKAIVAHMLLVYDVKLENDGVRPANMYLAEHCIPDTKAHLMFRARQT